MSQFTPVQTLSVVGPSPPAPLSMVYTTNHGGIIQTIMLIDCIFNTMFTIILSVPATALFVLMFEVGDASAGTIIFLINAPIMTFLLLCIFSLEAARGVWKATMEPNNPNHQVAVSRWFKLSCAIIFLIVILIIVVIILASIQTIPFGFIVYTAGGQASLVFLLSMRIVFTFFVNAFHGELQAKYGLPVFLATAQARAAQFNQASGVNSFNYSNSQSTTRIPNGDASTTGPISQPALN